MHISSSILSINITFLSPFSFNSKSFRSSCSFSLRQMNVCVNRETFKLHQSKMEFAKSINTSDTLRLYTICTNLISKKNHISNILGLSPKHSYRFTINLIPQTSHRMIWKSHSMLVSGNSFVSHSDMWGKHSDQSKFKHRQPTGSDAYISNHLCMMSKIDFHGKCGRFLTEKVVSFSTGIKVTFSIAIKTCTKTFTNGDERPLTFNTERNPLQRIYTHGCCFHTVKIIIHCLLTWWGRQLCVWMKKKGGSF